MCFSHFLTTLTTFSLVLQTFEHILFFHDYDDFLDAFDKFWTTCLTQLFDDFDEPSDAFDDRDSHDTLVGFDNLLFFFLKAEGVGRPDSRTVGR